jgi:hypothetical protein
LRITIRIKKQVPVLMASAASSMGSNLSVTGHKITSTSANVEIIVEWESKISCFCKERS